MSERERDKNRGKSSSFVRTDKQTPADTRGQTHVQTALDKESICIFPRHFSFSLPIFCHVIPAIIHLIHQLLHSSPAITVSQTSQKTNKHLFDRLPHKTAPSSSSVRRLGVSNRGQMTADALPPQNWPEHNSLMVDGCPLCSYICTLYVCMHYVQLYKKGRSTYSLQINMS